MAAERLRQAAALDPVLASAGASTQERKEQELVARGLRRAPSWQQTGSQTQRELLAAAHSAEERERAGWVLSTQDVEQHMPSLDLDRHAAHAAGPAVAEGAEEEEVLEQDEELESDAPSGSMPRGGVARAATRQPYCIVLGETAAPTPETPGTPPGPTAATAVPEGERIEAKAEAEAPGLPPGPAAPVLEEGGRREALEEEPPLKQENSLVLTMVTLTESPMEAVAALGERLVGQLLQTQNTLLQEMRQAHEAREDSLLQQHLQREDEQERRSRVREAQLAEKLLESEVARAKLEEQVRLQGKLLESEVARAKVEEQVRLLELARKEGGGSSAPSMEVPTKLKAEAPISGKLLLVCDEPASLRLIAPLFTQAQDCGWGISTLNSSGHAVLALPPEIEEAWQALDLQGLFDRRGELTERELLPLAVPQPWALCGYSAGPFGSSWRRQAQWSSRMARSLCWMDARLAAVFFFSENTNTEKKKKEPKAARP